MFKIMKDIKRELSVRGSSRKIAAVLLALCICLTFAFFAACGKSEKDSTEEGQADAQGTMSLRSTMRESI